MAVTIDGVEIAEHDIQAEVESLRPRYEAYTREKGEEPDAAQLRDWVIDNLIEEYVLEREARATQPVPSAERVQQELEKNAEAYEAVPEAERPAKASLAMQVRRLKRDIRKKARKPTEAELRSFYDKNPELFVAPEALRLQHICRLPGPAEKASDLLLLLRVKADVEHGRMTWADAVYEYSEMAEEDRGFFATVSRGELLPKYEEKLFALELGELSDVIDLSEDGGAESLHIFRAVERLAPEKMAYKNVKENVERAVIEMFDDDALFRKLDELKAKAVIVR